MDTANRDAPGVTRRLLEQCRDPESGRQLIMVEVTLAPGTDAPPHRHPVPGLVYILDGVAISAYGDEKPRRYRAGETLQDRADIPHTVFRNADPKRPLRFLVTYVLAPEREYVVPL